MELIRTRATHISVVQGQSLCANAAKKPAARKAGSIQRPCGTG